MTSYKADIAFPGGSVVYLDGSVLCSLGAVFQASTGRAAVIWGTRGVIPASATEITDPLVNGIELLDYISYHKPMNHFTGTEEGGSSVYDDPVGTVQWASKPGVPYVMDVLRKQTVDAASIDVTCSGMPSESFIIGVNGRRNTGVVIGAGVVDSLNSVEGDPEEGGAGGSYVETIGVRYVQATSATGDANLYAVAEHPYAGMTSATVGPMAHFDEAYDGAATNRRVPLVCAAAFPVQFGGYGQNEVFDKNQNVMVMEAVDGTAGSGSSTGYALSDGNPCQCRDNDVSAQSFPVVIEDAGTGGEQFSGQLDVATLSTGEWRKEDGSQFADENELKNYTGAIYLHNKDENGTEYRQLLTSRRWDKIEDANGNPAGESYWHDDGKGKEFLGSKQFVPDKCDEDGKGFLDFLSGILDVAGFFPIIGSLADIANAVVALAQGEYVDALVNLVGAIPGVGDVAAATFKGLSAAAAAGKVAGLLNTASNAGGCGKALKEGFQAAKKKLDDVVARGQKGVDDVISDMQRNNPALVGPDGSMLLRRGDNAGGAGKASSGGKNTGGNSNGGKSNGGTSNGGKSESSNSGGGSEHTKGARPSTKGKHEKGQSRRQQDRKGSKGEKNWPRKRPPDWKGGPYPPPYPPPGK